MKNLILIALLFPLTSYSAPKKIIGSDDRVQITNQNSEAYHESVAYLSVRVDNSIRVCTATVIGKRHAITAAHCLYDSRTYQMVRLAAIVPGIKSEKRKFVHYPYGYFTATKKRVLADYFNNLGPKYDLGLLTFKEDLPVKAIKLGVLPRKASFTIAGYPGDKVDGTLWESTGKRKISLWGYGMTTNEHDADTVSGQSGAALRYTGGGYDQIVGVHSGSEKTFMGDDVNNAFFFTNKTIEIINNWMKEDLN